MWGDKLIKSWAKTQPILALSTGEAELAAVVKASSEALGLKSLMTDLGIQVSLAVRSDATAAIGMVRREGLGKVRHLDVGDLCVQQKAKSGTISYHKVNGKENPADMLTKGIGAAEILKHNTFMGLEERPGRSGAAPQLPSL